MCGLEKGNKTLTFLSSWEDLTVCCWFCSWFLLLFWVGWLTWFGYLSVWVFFVLVALFCFKKWDCVCGITVICHPDNALTSCNFLFSCRFAPCKQQCPRCMESITYAQQLRMVIAIVMSLQMTKTCQGLFPGPKGSRVQSLLSGVFSFPPKQGGLAHNAYPGQSQGLNAPTLQKRRNMRNK